MSVDRISESLTDFSPSRLGVIGKCGLAFEYQYVKRLPAPYESARAILGTVVHDGVEQWYALPDNGYQTADLAPIVLAQWQSLLPPVIWERILELRDIAEECEAVAAAIRFQRPNVKAPTQTKAYLEAGVVREFGQKRAAMIELCDALETIKWPKDEDPYKAYCKSAEFAAAMQKRWQPLPPPVAVEVPFRVEFEGFAVRGRIDQVRADPTRDGEIRHRIVDIKTGIQALTQMEAFLQMFLYSEASYQIPEIPDITDIALYLARKDQYQQGKIDRRRHSRLASRILNGRARQIAMGQFEPSYGFWCKQCDFNDLCSSEIALWQGDGLVAELMD